jgi:glycosyltransferase involved in cell wall biosynthesis
MKVLVVGGHDVNARTPLADELRRRGLEVDLAGLGYRGNDPAIGSVGSRWWRSSTEIRAMVAARRPDVIHVVDTTPSLAVLRSGLGNTPVVRTVTGVGWSYSVGGAAGVVLRRVYGLAQRRYARRAALTIFQNSDDRALFVEQGWVKDNRTRLIGGSGVDQTKFPAPHASAAAVRREFALADDTFFVVLPARLLKAKGIDDFIVAFEHFARRTPGVDAFFAVAGEAERSRLRGIKVPTRTIGRARLTHIGHRRDLPSVLAAADVIALPTRYREGIPRVLLEGALSETCLVATDMPGCRDLIVDNVSGRLSPPGDPRVLADILIDLSESPSDRHRLAQEARRQVLSTFTLSYVSDAYIKVYAEVTMSNHQKKESIV